MNRLSQPLRRLTSFCSTRRGSMLIMVIVILVLLALIGTAMISTARIDRLTTVQHAANTQIDLLLQSVKDISTAAIENSLFGTTASGRLYKASSDQSAAGSAAYLPYDAYPTDAYLASRLPTVPNTALSAAAANMPRWLSLTMPLLGTTFDAPGYASTPINFPKGRYYFEPTTGSFGGQTTWPFIQIWVDNSVSGPPTYVKATAAPIPAADTDGDGIADSLLFKLPVGELNGISYYAAVRIIDNNSAVNLSTAWKQNDDWQDVSVGEVPGNFFPTNIDLPNFLGGATATISNEIGNLNIVRFPGDFPAGYNAYKTGVPAIDDTGALRPDFSFTTQYEMAWNQLGRRLLNPGFDPSGARCVAVTDSDGVALAYPFGQYRSSLNTSAVGNLLPTSLQNNAATVAYQPGDVITWYNKSYDLRPINQPVWPVRALTVTHNGIATTGTQHLMTGTAPIHYITGLTTSAIQPNAMTAYPVNTAVPKVSINTALFPELWRGFWNVMCDKPNTAPYDLPAVTPPTTYNTHNITRMFSPVFRVPPGALPAAGTTPPATPNAVTPFEMLQLRAAIAAVNTMDLRDADDDVTSRKVTIYRNDGTATGTPTFEAMVYGTEKQPYITEVYADNYSGVYTGIVAASVGKTNPKGYVAIELHNPYDTDLLLPNWTIGVIDRRDGITYPLAIRQITPTAAPTITWGAHALPFPPLTPAATHPVVRIPARGYIVLENFPPPGETAPSPNDAQYRPDNAVVTGTSIYIPNLSDVLPDPAVPITAGSYSGSELVLLRVRNASGVPVNNSGDNKNPYNELSILDDPVASPTTVQNAMADMVPVDSFDFSNFPLATAAPYAIMHYVRENGGTAGAPDYYSHDWKFVYPGPYVTTAATARQGVVQPFNPPIDANPPAPTTTVTLGAMDAISNFTNNFPPIQLNPKDFGGPNGAQPWDANRLYVAGDVVMDNNLRYIAIADSTIGTRPPGAGWNAYLAANNGARFPFGAFARNGDMLQIPYIGAYRIRPSVDPPGAASNTFLEMNAVTMDSLYAEDGEPADDAFEQIGRFCPISDDPVALANVALQAVANGTTYYDWASDFFDYFTVQAPNDDYLPNVNITGAEPGETLAKYPGTPVPAGVGNSSSASINNNLENTAPVEGLININTASPLVLSSVPMLPNVNQNQILAQLIVDWRDGTGSWAGTPHGPFKSIMDLNKVVAASPPNTTIGFQNGLGAYDPVGFDADDLDGDISPLSTTMTAGAPTASPDGKLNDFEAKYLMVNRVSNLVTPRSDVYTVYILLQGWRNAAGATPELAVQRKAVMMVDRGGVVKTTDTAAVTNVPSN